MDDEVQARCINLRRDYDKRRSKRVHAEIRYQRKEGAKVFIEVAVGENERRNNIARGNRLSGTEYS